jgi:Zn finger protein HypA/HybF involved in hydrogenase expression
MHEVAAMRGIVATVLEQMQAAGATRVTTVELVLGASGHLSEDAARQYWEVFTRDTPAHDAAVIFTWLPATYQCFSCMQRFPVTRPSAVVACPACGDIALEVEHEDTCAVRSLDVAFDDESMSTGGASQVVGTQ